MNNIFNELINNVLLSNNYEISYSENSEQVVSKINILFNININIDHFFSRKLFTFWICG